MFEEEFDTTFDTRPEAEAPAEPAGIDELHDSEPSLVDRIYGGDVDYRSLDAATRKTVLGEAYNRLDEKGKKAWDNQWRDKPFFLGKDRRGNDVPWKTAEEFLETLELPPVQKEREGHQRLVEELRKSKEEIDRLKKMTKMNLDRNLENDEATVDFAIKKAKEEFDVDGLEKALERKANLQKNKDEIKQYYEAPVQNEQPVLSEQEQLARLSQPDREAYLNFKSRNLWWGIDQTMSQFVSGEWESMQYANHMDFPQKLEYLEKRTRQAFPSKFPKNNTTLYMPTTTKTASPTLKTENKNNTDTIYSNLPDRDKQKISNLIASGKFVNKEAVMKNFGLI